VAGEIMQEANYFARDRRILACDCRREKFDADAAKRSCRLRLLQAWR